MDSRDEIQELIQQAAEHLRCFGELGITHFNEATPELRTKKQDDPIGRVKPPPIAPPHVPRQVEAVGWVAPPDSAPISEPTLPKVETMPARTKKKDQPAPTTSLFGDIAPPEPTEEYGAETLEDIRRDLGDCQRCKLWETRANLVFGEGSEQAQLMFVGEAPGADEDASGRPFVGRAGQLLTKMIEAIGLQREDVYIANVLKTRPPGNRNPERDEIEACVPFLYRQIAVIRPKLIVTLGNPATQSLLNIKTGISQMRGTFQDYPRLAGVKVLPTFHPAYLLRAPDKKREAWEDLKKVRAFLQGLN